MDKEDQLKQVLFQNIIMVSKMLSTKFLKGKRFKNAVNTGYMVKGLLANNKVNIVTNLKEKIINI